MEGLELTRLNPPLATVARLTPRGRGAVATLRLLGSPASLDAGDPALFQATNGQQVIDQPSGRLVFGHFGADSPEEVVICRLDAETLELHCHGGDAAVERIVRELSERGVVTVSPWQSEPQRVDSLETECLAALANALTPRMANLAHSQATGVLRRAVMAALIALPNLVKTGELLRAIWRWREVGRHVTVPWRVAVVGRPNVGKSRLINALLGYDRSIVYDAPGTTRDVLTGETAFDGWPVQLADTAGLREAGSAIEAEGIVRARDYLATADVVLVVVDRSQPATRTDRELVAEFPHAILLANKCDLPEAWVDPLPDDVLSISATTRAGLRRVGEEVVRRLVTEGPGSGDAIPLCERQITCLERAIEAADQGDCDGCRARLWELLGSHRVDGMLPSDL